MPGNSRSVGIASVPIWQGPLTVTFLDVRHDPAALAFARTPGASWTVMSLTASPVAWLNVIAAVSDAGA